MAEVSRVVGFDAEGFVEFWSTGDSAKGDFHCSECGYGVTVYRQLPLCPMCGSTVWEQSAWSPFTRAHAAEESQPPAL